MPIHLNGKIGPIDCVLFRCTSLRGLLDDGHILNGCTRSGRVRHCAVTRNSNHQMLLTSDLSCPHIQPSPCCSQGPRSPMALPDVHSEKCLRGTPAQMQQFGRLSCRLAGIRTVSVECCCSSIIHYIKQEEASSNRCQNQTR